MHGHGHPEHAKKLNDKILKTVDEMFERIRAFIRGEVASGSAELSRPPQYRRSRSFRKISHLIKDIRQSNQRNGSQGRNDVKVINMMNDKRNRKRPYKGEESGLTKELTFLAIPRNSLTDEPIILEGMIEGHQYRASLIGFSGEAYHPLGVIDLQITMGEAGRNKTVLMEFAIVRCRSSYNVLIGRIKMRSLGAVGSTIHSMIKFPKYQGVVTMETSKEALIQEQTILRARNNPGHKPGKEPMLPEKERGEGNMGEKVTICNKQSDQSITIRSTLSLGCKQRLINILQKNVDILAWAGLGEQQYRGLSWNIS
ncbi:hypothetical protein Tco_1273514 [Tanacetum coccineum]